MLFILIRFLSIVSRTHIVYKYYILANQIKMKIRVLKVTPK